MKRRFLQVGFLASVLLIIAARPERSSSGAPGAHTGAPGEQTCATSGCHDDNTPNSGSAKLTIDVLGAESNYLPGKTYSIQVKIADPEVSRFGFQLMAYDAFSKKSIGTFQITDLARTQLTKNTKLFADREYVTYSFKGTDVTSPGESVWVVNWTAPEEAEGPVSFFAAGVSANDDMSDKGDRVYTTSKIFKN